MPGQGRELYHSPSVRTDDLNIETPTIHKQRRPVCYTGLSLDGDLYR